MKQITFLGLLLFWAAGAFGQAIPAFSLVREYPGNVTDFSVDNLGNLYLVYQDGQLKKLRSNGDSMAVFNNVRRHGKLYSIDVSNPLKVLLYYRNFGTIVILDRFLNERAVLDLRRLNLVQVKAIAQSYDNNIWLYDELESKLKKVDDDGRLIDQSNDFRLTFDSAPSPSMIIDQDKYVYLYDPEKGIYTFDYFGGFKNRLPFTRWKDFNVINNTLVGRNESTLFRYDNGTLDLKELSLPEFLADADKMVIGQGNIYVMKEGKLRIYAHEQK